MLSAATVYRLNAYVRSCKMKYPRLKTSVYRLDDSVKLFSPVDLGVVWIGAGVVTATEKIHFLVKSLVRQCLEKQQFTT